MNFLFVSPPGQFEKAFTGLVRPIEDAVDLSFRKMAEEILTRGRADISSGGFTSRWVRGLNVKVKPANKPSSRIADYSAKVGHRLPVIAVFQDGAVIHGHPYIWIPLPGIPEKIGGRRMTPRRFAASIGPLTFVRRPGQAPLLLGPAKGIRSGRIGLAALRRGQRENGDKVPIFIGLKEVHLRKRIHTNEIVAEEAAKLPALYNSSFVGPKV